MKKIINKISYSIMSVILAVFLTIFLPLSVYGISPIQQGALAAQGAQQPAQLFGSAGIFTVISNAMLFLVGALSVIMLIIGGLRYVISGGNTSAITGAKNTVLYAIVGLIVALVSYSVINFVLVSLH